MRPGFSRSIQLKLLVPFGLLVGILVAAGGYGLYGFSRITTKSRVMTETNLPVLRAISEALVAILGGTSAFSEAVRANDFAEIDAVRTQEANLNNAAILFDMYLSAITWGSETEAFQRSDGRLNAAEWRRLDLTGRLIIERPVAEQVQRAGIANLYASAFAENARQALAQRKKFLRLQMEGDVAAAQEAKQQSDQRAARAQRFASLTTGTLSEIARAASLSASRNSQAIAATEAEIGRSVPFISFAGLFIYLVASIAFTRWSIVRPVNALTAAARKIAAGDLAYRPRIASRDEFGALANVFTHMADRLAAYPLELEHEVSRRTQKLEELLQENYQSAKLLVSKDRELTLANISTQNLIAELTEVGKILIRRDLELSRANERLQELDVLKSEFVSVAAHQLRTPLTAVKWALSSLLEETAGRLPAHHRKTLGDAYRATQRLIELIGDLLDVARLEEGRYGFRFNPGPIVPIVREAFGRFQQTAQDKGLTFSLELPETDPPVLRIDAERIDIALDNLIDNAVKYTPPGGSVTVRVVSRPEAVAVEVTDTGIGVPESQQHRVFTKFFRSHNARLLETSGSGLGLYLAKNIVERHDGSMDFQSIEGQGSTFTITLPIPHPTEVARLNDNTIVR